MCDYENLCLELLDSSWMGIAFETILGIVAFVGIAQVADAHLCQALETLCARWSIPEDVAGASFMAFGSAAPEIIINAVSTVKGAVANQKGNGYHEAFSSSLGVSSIIGSGMMAFSLIPGVCALACESPLLLTRRPLARDVIAYMLSLIALQVIMADGVVTASEAMCLLVFYAVYLVVVFVSPIVRRQWCAPKAGSKLADVEKLSEVDYARDEENEEEVGVLMGLASAIFQPLFSLLRWTCPECEAESATAHLYGVTLCSAFIWLSLFSMALSAVVTRWGTILGIPAPVMGMYVVAVGAQVPDAIQAVAVARRGLGSMAVASATGSQVVNVLVGLGLPWLLSNTAGHLVYIPKHEELSFMSRFMFGCLVAYVAVLLLPTVSTWGSRGRAILGKREGWMLIAIYGIVISLYGAASWIWTGEVIE